MRHVPPPDVDDESVFDAIVTAKRGANKTRLSAVRTRVLSAYADYLAAAPDVQALPGLVATSMQKAALRHAYEGETVPMKALRTTLKARVSVVMCLFCGISEAGTLDHYLPKEDHPQFSVFSLNLVPACGGCNTLKRRLVVDEATAVRLFFHPYYDPVPDETIMTLSITLRPDALALIYGVARPPGMNASTYSRLRSHFRLLNLANRYTRMSLFELRGYDTPLDRFHAAGGTALVSRELARKAEREAERRGPNDWRVILFRALSEHAAFCDLGFRVLSRIQ